MTEQRDRILEERGPLWKEAGGAWLKIASWVIILGATLAVLGAHWLHTSMSPKDRRHFYKAQILLTQMREKIADLKVPRHDQHKKISVYLKKEHAKVLSQLHWDLHYSRCSFLSSGRVDSCVHAAADAILKFAHLKQKYNYFRLRVAGAREWPDPAWVKKHRPKWMHYVHQIIAIQKARNWKINVFDTQDEFPTPFWPSSFGGHPF